MKGNARDTLTLPFEKGDLELPTPDSRGVFLNAQALRSSIEWESILDCEQSDRGKYLELEQLHYAVEPEIAEKTWEFGLILAGKHKRLNESNIHRALKITKPAGLITVAGEKTAGIASLRKYVGGFVPLEGSLSKHHGTVFWFKNPGDKISLNSSQHTSPEGYNTRPGMFSADHIDPGSALLVSHFDKRIAGNVADIGAGWGYLSHQLLLHAGKIAHLDLYESDWHALEAAKANVVSDEARIGLYWTDVVEEKIERSYDWIIMNPPFHSGRKAEPQFGQKFLESASQSLRKGGHLLMVANRNLPYENTIERLFTRHTKLVETSAYKIIEAVK